MSWLLIAFAFDLSIWPGRFAACLHFFCSPFKCIRTHAYISYLYFSLTATLDGQCNECSPSLHFISAGHAFGRQFPRKMLRKLHMCVCVSDLNKAHTFQALLVMLLILSSWWRALAQLAIRVPHVGPYGYANMSTSQTLYAAQKFNNTNRNTNTRRIHLNACIVVGRSIFYACVRPNGVKWNCSGSARQIVNMKIKQKQQKCIRNIVSFHVSV